jgi:hypothetical protein
MLRVLFSPLAPHSLVRLPLFRLPPTPTSERDIPPSFPLFPCTPQSVTPLPPHLSPYSHHSYAHIYTCPSPLPLSGIVRIVRVRLVGGGVTVWLGREMLDDDWVH